MIDHGKRASSDVKDKVFLMRWRTCYLFRIDFMLLVRAYLKEERRKPT